MNKDDYRIAKRLIADVVIFFDPDEPLGAYGIEIGTHAGRVLEALTSAGFELSRTSKRERRA